MPSPAAQLDRCFADLTGGAAADEEVAIGAGRRMRLVSGRGVARASFERLCGTALGAGDYVALAQRYHTLCVDDLPQMSLRRRDQASADCSCGRPPTRARLRDCERTRRRVRPRGDQPDGRPRRRRA